MKHEDPKRLALEAMIATVQKQMDGALTVNHKKAAEILGMRSATLFDIGDDGQIDYLQRGKRRHYTLPALIAYLTATEKTSCQSTAQKQAAARKAAKHIAMTSNSKVVGFRAAREKRLNEKRNNSSKT